MNYSFMNTLPRRALAASNKPVKNPPLDLLSLLVESGMKKHS